MELFRLIFIGIFIGMANVIPGVSGGTLAVIFGIYEKFVNAITLNLKKLKENWKFLVPLLAGMAGGVLLFSKLIKTLYENFPVQTNYAFTGLILGSIPMLFTYMIKKEEPEKKFSAGKIAGIIIAALIGLALLITFHILKEKLGGQSDEISFELPQISVPLLIKLFIGGIIGAITMVIPGISGSLIMLIFGVYPIVMGALNTLFHWETFLHSLFLLLPNGIGVVIGLISGAKLVSYLLKKQPNITYAVIFGLICGSAITFFPGFSEINSVVKGIACFLSLCGGAAMSFFSAKLAPKEENKKND